MTDNPVCSRCGNRLSEHGIDQYTGEPTKCPVYRAEPVGLGGETTPRGDY